VSIVYSTVQYSTVQYSEMPLCRGEGERRGWRLIGVKCMAGNPSQGLAVARREFGELTGGGGGGGELTRFDSSRIS